MNERRTPLEKEEPKHKKRSKKRGQPRADHKHEYKTVLLYRWYDHPWHQGERNAHELPTKVCMVCGRIDDIDYSRYEYIDVDEPTRYHTKERVIKKPDELEKWDCESLDKFAHKRVSEEI